MYKLTVGCHTLHDHSILELDSIPSFPVGLSRGYLIHILHVFVPFHCQVAGSLLAICALPLNALHDKPELQAS